MRKSVATENNYRKNSSNTISAKKQYQGLLASAKQSIALQLHSIALKLAASILHSQIGKSLCGLPTDRSSPATSDFTTMGDYAGKGRDLVKKADKKLGSFSLFGSGSKYDEAADVLEKACNQLKLGKACE